jgi:multicomponent Na+:H+ antiporter subunit D
VTEPVVLVVLVPLSAAIATLLLRGGLRTGSAIAGSLATVGAAAGLAIEVHGSGAVLHLVGGWAAPLGIGLRADGLATSLVLMTSVVAAAVGAYAIPYLRATASGETRDRARTDAWWPVWFLVWAALHALYLSADIFNVYVTLELVTLGGVALIVLGDGTAALAAAMRYLLAAFVGSLAYLLGVALLYGETGTLDMGMLADAGSRTPAGLVAIGLMTAGLLLKTALFPLHFWLPRAHAAAPTPASAALSALVVKASFAVLLRIWFEAMPTVPTLEAAHLVGLLGALAIAWGSVQAFRARRLKMLVAHSTVAQVGYLFLLVPLGWATVHGTAPGTDPAVAWGGGLYQVIAHAFAKAAMFLAAGTLLLRYGHDRIDDLGGAARRAPAAVLAFGLAGVGLIGLPPMAGFVAKLLLLEAALTTGLWPYAVVILGGGLLTAAYVFRFLERAFSAEAGDATAGGGHRAGTTVPAGLAVVPLALALAGVALGLAASWPLELIATGNPLVTAGSGG